MRRIVEDYEARLEPPPGSEQGKGKIEWERYADGNEQLHVRFRHLDLGDGAYVSIRLDGAILGYAKVTSGAGRLRFETEKGQVPKAAAGQLVEIVHGEAVLLRGVLEPD